MISGVAGTLGLSCWMLSPSAGAGRLTAISEPVSLSLAQRATAPAREKLSGHHHGWDTSRCGLGTGGHPRLVPRSSPAERDHDGRVAVPPADRGIDKTQGDHATLTLKGYGNQRILLDSGKCPGLELAGSKPFQMIRQQRYGARMSNEKLGVTQCKSAISPILLAKRLHPRLPRSHAAWHILPSALRSCSVFCLLRARVSNANVSSKMSCCLHGVPWFQRFLIKYLHEMDIL
jgi:hypothetical protein